MYKIKEGIELELNRVTPKSVKKYQEKLKAEGVKSQEDIMQYVQRELTSKITNNEINVSELRNIINNAVQEQVINSLNVFVDETFFKEWVEIIFNITDEQKTKLFENFEETFYVDEFMRGYYDFFSRLRMSSKQ